MCGVDCAPETETVTRARHDASEGRTNAMGMDDHREYRHRQRRSARSRSRGGIEVVAVLEKRDAFLKQRPWSFFPLFLLRLCLRCERGVVGSFPNDDECNQSSRVPPRLANRKRNNLRKHRKRFVRSNGCDSSLLHRGGRIRTRWRSWTDCRRR